MEQLVILGRHWDGRHLCVSDIHQGSIDLAERIFGVILSIFRFKKFTDSRWLTIGDSARTLLAALFVGLRPLVDMTRQDGKGSDYYLNGFQRLTSEILLYITVVFVVAFVPDSFLHELLSDDRMADRLFSFKEILKHELDWILSLEASIWNRLCMFSTSSPLDLQSVCINGGLKASAFIHRRCISVLVIDPWRITRGNIDDNLIELAEQEEPQDVVMMKMWRFLKMKLNRKAIKTGIELMKSIPWSTVGVEQGHGSTAVIHRFRKCYEDNSLMGRSLVSL